MNNEIYKLLTDNSTIVGSWGINDIKSHEDIGIKFKVTARRFKGLITIVPDLSYVNTYDVRIGDHGYICNKEMIIQLIDNDIEKIE